MVQRFRKAVERAEIPRGATVVVGFSGGSDSLALARLVTQVAPAHGLCPLLVHVDHRLREDSAGDAEGCGRLAAQLGAPFEVVTLQTPIPEIASGLGLEEAARRERHQQLALAARRAGARWICLGHQADDQAETVLLHLFRGTGTHGSAGMREVQSMPIPWWDGIEPLGTFSVWRPLLAERRAALQAFLRSEGLVWLEDPTNADPRWRRNRLRQQILPEIEAAWPGAVAAIGRFAALSAEDADLLEELTQVAIDRHGGLGSAIPVADLMELPLPLRRRWVRRWLHAAGVTEPTADRVAEVLSLAERCRRNLRIEVGSGFEVTCRAAYLTIAPAGQQTTVQGGE